MAGNTGLPAEIAGDERAVPNIGLYRPISGGKAIEKAVAGYAGPKGNLQFPLDKPIPYALIGRIVKLRVKQDAAKAAAKRKKSK